MNKYLIVALMILSGSSFAVTNKWIDDQGMVHYSDQMPPAHAKDPSTIYTSPPVAAVSGVPTSGKPAADKDAAKNDAAAKKAAADKAAQEAAVKAQNQANCLAAKQNLANLKDGMRIATIDLNTGERSYMDDAQRQKSIDEAQQQIGKFCQ
jgi:hypothetical protein